LKPVKLQDVADKAGVSPKTVSRVVNREPRVSPATREKVLQVIEELNFQPNKSAQNLASDRSRLIGLIYDNPSPSYITGLQEGVLRVCDRSGYGLIIHPSDRQDVDLAGKLRTLVTSTRMDGVLLTPPFTENEAVLEILQDSQTPYVLISPLNLDPAQLSVWSDDFSASKQAMQHLLDLGHQRIGFVRGLRNRSGSEMRFLGYQDSLEENGIPFDPALIVEGQFTFENAEKGARKLLLLDDRPTAIFASSDYMAAGVMKAAINLNISVPEDLSLCGFDDNPIARYLTPTLTTMRHPVRKLAASAAEKLIGKLTKTNEGQDTPPIYSELIVRESTAPAIKKEKKFTVTAVT
jgi:LacI family transcriptional regulator